MTFQEQQKELTDRVISSISSIEQRPEGWLPHKVFVEEVDDGGNPTYKAYELIDFNPDNSCTLQDMETGKEDEERHLSEINIDWLIAVYNYCCDLLEESRV